MTEEEKKLLEEAIESILDEVALPLEKLAQISDENALTCDLGINFEYCDLWDQWEGCMNCSHYLARGEFHE